MKRRQWLVKGRVQGVGFRAAARKKALEHELVGVVRNLDGGNVQVIAQGKPRCLDHLERWMRTGPLHARVERVEPSEPDERALNWDTLSGFRVE